MRSLIKPIISCLFCFCAILPIQLLAQETDALISNFKAFSFFSNEGIADSLFYNPEMAMAGPVQFVEDSLEIYSENGAFQLNYAPGEDSAFVNLWVDNNEDGIFEEQERVYSGLAKAGSLSDNVKIQIPNGSQRALLAISKVQENIANPSDLLKNDRISSLRFIIRAAPPKLTMTSKKETRDTTEIFCESVPIELRSGTGFPCFTISNWVLTHPPNNPMTVDPNDVTFQVSGTPFALGDTVYSGQLLFFDLDISGFTIPDGDAVTFNCFYANCADSTLIDSVAFTFTKDCMSTPIFERTDQHLDLKISPNPLRSETIIHYELPLSGRLNISLMDAKGRLVEKIKTGSEVSGKHELKYAPQNLPKGLYYLILQTDHAIISKKVIILSP